MRAGVGLAVAGGALIVAGVFADSWQMLGAGLVLAVGGGLALT